MTTLPHPHAQRHDWRTASFRICGQAPTSLNFNDDPCTAIVFYKAIRASSALAASASGSSLAARASSAA
jgi:hypothetical protein